MNSLVVSDEDARKAVDLFSDPSFRTKRGIQEFSEYIENHPDNLGKSPFPLFHDFADGIYTREIHVPRGQILVGALHNHESMVYVLKGKIIVADIYGVKVIDAPYQFTSKPGVKRVALVVDDVVWVDIHATEKTTVEDAEAELFTDNYSEFELLCEDIGRTPEEVRSISECVHDLVSDNNPYIEIETSEIEGLGIFVTKDFEEGDVLGNSRIDDNRTELGRYTNHSSSPNASCLVKDNLIQFIANRPIKSGEEITVHYIEAGEAARELDEKNKHREIERA